MSLDAKSFDLDVFRFPNLKIKDFNILKSCPWMLKASIWIFWGSPKLQIEDFDILGSCP